MLTYLIHEHNVLDELNIRILRVPVDVSIEDYQLVMSCTCNVI